MEKTSVEEIGDMGRRYGGNRCAWVVERWNYYEGSESDVMRACTLEGMLWRLEIAGQPFYRVARGDRLDNVVSNSSILPERTAIT